MKIINRIRKSKSIKAVGLVSTAAIIIFIFGSIAYSNITPRSESSSFQKGMCYVTWNPQSFMGPKSDESLKAMAEVGVNCVQIVPTWYQDTIHSLVIKEDEDRTPSDPSVRHAIQTAHRYGMAVMLKPHIDLLTDDGNTRSDIGFSSEADWERWFSNYKKFIKRYAQMAQDEGVEFFSVGTELSYAQTKTEAWRDRIIPMVREIFKGKITYAANWDSYKTVKFWDMLDFAGVDAYFPLCNDASPTCDMIKESWKKWVNEIEAWQKEINKPIVFTECGYCSADTAAKRPWEDAISGSTNLKLQADCYRALMETFCPREWFAGLYWWNWNTYSGSGGENNKRFTPQNKPALQHVKAWYSQSLGQGQGM